MRFILGSLIIFAALHVNAGFASVKSYFNYNPNSSYSDPYRNISRKGDNLEQVILKEIKAAKKSIFVAVQELRLPLIAQALIEKHNAGVDVRIVLENSYNFDTKNQKDPGENEHEASRIAELIAFVDANRNRKLEIEELESRDAIYMLKKAKIKIMDDTFGESMGSALMHHKFVIIDERVVIVSTANFTMSCIHGDVLTSSSRGNANSVLVMESTSAADIFVEEFTEMWGNGRTGSYGLRKRYRAPRTVSVGSSRVTIQFSPTSKSQNWNASVNGLIGRTLARATRSVKTALFVFSDQQLSNILEPVASKGVEVGVLIEKMFAYRAYSELLDMAGLEMPDEDCQRDPGNRIWKSPIKEGGMTSVGPGDILHHKFGVVDGKTVIVGSQNWTESANYANDETLVVVENSSIADSYTREYARMKSKSSIGTPDYVLRRIKEINSQCRLRR